MFELFVKDFVYGTQRENVSLERYIRIISSWKEGYDIEIDGKKIPNKRIESIYSRLIK